MNKFVKEQREQNLVRYVTYKEFEYAMPASAFRESSTGDPLFNVLKCYYKCPNPKSLSPISIWNPFFAHEIIDKHFKTSYQVVDYSLYCPLSYLYDDHTISLELFEFFGNLVGRQPYKIHTFPRVVGSEGEDLSKSAARNQQDSSDSNG